MPLRVGVQTNADSSSSVRAPRDPPSSAGVGMALPRTRVPPLVQCGLWLPAEPGSRRPQAGYARVTTVREARGLRTAWVTERQGMYSAGNKWPNREVLNVQTVLGKSAREYGGLSPFGPNSPRPFEVLGVPLAGHQGRQRRLGVVATGPIIWPKRAIHCEVRNRQNNTELPFTPIANFAIRVRQFDPRSAPQPGAGRPLDYPKLGRSPRPVPSRAPGAQDGLPDRVCEASSRWTDDP